MLKHGGRLRQAAVTYRIPEEAWVDLSTGINPCGWPLVAVPETAWRRLPDDDDLLEQAASHYYQTASLLAVAGSQAAIQLLPHLRPSSRVGIFNPTYAEHAHSWEQEGHRVEAVTVDIIEDVVDTTDVLVMVNPNNPSGHRWPASQLLEWHHRLELRGGWLVVDEAFVDPMPEDSLATHCSKPGLIVLRSLGKFFGLAGLRVGFVLSDEDLLTRLRERLGPWPIANASRWLATHALADSQWQIQAREHLRQAEIRLKALLTDVGLAPTGGCALFQWVCTHDAAETHRCLAERGILTRFFDQPQSIRFGLPGTEYQWERLQSALHAMQK